MSYYIITTISSRNARNVMMIFYDTLFVAKTLWTLRGNPPYCNEKRTSYNIILHGEQILCRGIITYKWYYMRICVHCRRPKSIGIWWIYLCTVYCIHMLYMYVTEVPYRPCHGISVANRCTVDAAYIRLTDRRFSRLQGSKSDIVDGWGHEWGDVVRFCVGNN